MNVGLLTCTLHPLLYPEDRLIVDELASKGIRGEPFSWDDPGLTRERVRSFDMVVVRTPWNYATDPARFKRWLDWLESCDVPVWNPLELIRWNFDKHYLLQLERSGVKIAPSAFVDGQALKGFDHYKELFGAGKLVGKPTVSAGAANTHILSSQRDFERLDGSLHWIIQPFLPEIQNEGEWSLLFFGGEFSHSLVKRPAAGDFRVQSMFQGTWSFEEAPDVLIAQAAKIVSKVPAPWLYARVDGVRRGDQFMLMELELFEPQLFLQGRRDLAARFVEKLLEKTGACR